MQEDREASVIEALTSMFPEIDPDTLLSVYHASNQNVEAAVELLLTMTSDQLVADQPGASASATSQEPAARASAHGGGSQQQIDDDEAIARQLQEQILLEEHEQQRAQHPFALPHSEVPDPLSGYPGAAYMGVGYPGAGCSSPSALGLNVPYHTSLYRPPHWGAEQPPQPAQQEGHGITDGLYSTGSAVYSAGSNLASSLWSWAVGDADDKKSDEATPAQEMQPIRRGAPRDFCGPRQHRDSSTSDADSGAANARDGGARSWDHSMGGSGRNDGGYREAEDDSETVIIGSNGYSGGSSGGEVRRRARHVPRSEDDLI